MKIIKTVKTLSKICREVHEKGLDVGFVPTMGALHEGHLSLVRKSVEQSDVTIVSIFVNPTQFGPGEDFDRYPRTLKADCEILRQLNPDYIFAPVASELYQENEVCSIALNPNSECVQALCGQYRPGHFDGVATVLAKFWGILGANVTYMGAKDYQQGVIIKKLAEDFNFPVKVQLCPIVREKDGLAMSSRNRYLKPSERSAALCLIRELRWIRSQVKKEWSAKLISIARRRLEAELNVQYLEARDATTLGKVSSKTKKMVVAVAAFVGKTRLIDNVTMSLRSRP